MDVKLVDYSESSSGEEHKQTESKKIAIVQPVPQDKSSSEQFSEHLSEYQHEEARSSSPQPTEDTDLPIEIEMPEPEPEAEPEPEVILLSSDSETVSFLTDITLGEFL